MARALTLSPFTAATAFMSIVFASSAVPKGARCCASAAGEITTTTAAVAVAIMSIRTMALFALGAMREEVVMICALHLMGELAHRGLDGAIMQASLNAVNCTAVFIRSNE